MKILPILILLVVVSSIYATGFVLNNVITETKARKEGISGLLDITPLPCISAEMDNLGEEDWMHGPYERLLQARKLSLKARAMSTPEGRALYDALYMLSSVGGRRVAIYEVMRRAERECDMTNTLACISLAGYRYQLKMVDMNGIVHVSDKARFALWETRDILIDQVNGSETPFGVDVLLEESIKLANTATEDEILLFARIVRGLFANK